MAGHDSSAHISETEMALLRHKTVEQLLRALVHELNNQLCAIQGFGELSMTAAPEGSAASANLQQVLEACSRAREVIEQLNALTHSTRQAARALDLQRVVPELVRLLRRSRRPGVELRVTIDPDARDVIGNVADLQVMLTALIDSAEADLVGTGGTIDLSVWHPVDTGHDGAGGVVRFSVAQRRAAISGPPTARRPEQSPGAAGSDRRRALALARAAALRLGGQSVAIEPTSETAAVIHIDLPVKQSVEPRANPTEARAARTGERVLFVDDEPSLVDLGREMLMWLGYDPEVTTDARNALERFRDDPNRYVCVITDHTMPIMSGEQLVAELRKIEPRVPIIVCSGHKEEMNPERAREHGVAGYLSKPFSIDQLGRAIRRAVRPDARPQEG